MSDPAPHDPTLIERLSAWRQGREVVPCYGEHVEKDGYMVCQKCGGRERIGGENREDRVTNMILTAGLSLLFGAEPPKK